MSYWDACARCGRRRVVLVYRVTGRLYTFASWLERGATGQVLHDERRRRYVEGADLLRRRGRGWCLLEAECKALVARRRKRQKQRGELPADADFRKPREGVRGECRWCGEPIYRRDKTGRVVVDRTRMWHQGRLVHPDAEPEPDCLREYKSQAFTFREQVFRRDRGVCAECGRDCHAEREAWFESRPDMTGGNYEDRWAAYEEWRKAEPAGWHADHVVALEDGGEHLMANAQTLCGPCHTAKTARENSERAARRRAEARMDEPGLGDSLSLL